MIEVPPSSLFTALLVDPDHVDRVSAHAALAEAGFQVIATNNYQDAEDVLLARPPLILVTAVRLGAHNGLQLAVRGQAKRPRMAVVITSSVPHPEIQADTERLGGTFVLKPVGCEDFLAAVSRTVLQSGGRAGAEPIRPPFERRRGERRVEQAQVAVERRRGPRRRDLRALLRELPTAV